MLKKINLVVLFVLTFASGYSQVTLTASLVPNQVGTQTNMISFNTQIVASNSFISQLNGKCSGMGNGPVLTQIVQYGTYKYDNVQKKNVILSDTTIALPACCCSACAPDTFSNFTFQQSLCGTSQFMFLPQGNYFIISKINFACMQSGGVGSFTADTIFFQGWQGLVTPQMIQNDAIANYSLSCFTVSGPNGNIDSVGVNWNSSGSDPLSLMSYIPWNFLYVSDSPTIIQDIQSGIYFKNHTLNVDYFNLAIPPNYYNAFTRWSFYNTHREFGKVYYLTASNYFDFAGCQYPGYNLFAPVVSFTKSSNISNNYIKSNNQVLCITNNAYKPSTFEGSDPLGGIGTYTYLWQRSVDGGVSWQNDLSPNNNSKDFTPALTGVQIPTINPSIVLFRRISNSGSYADTSLPASITLLPALYNPEFMVEQEILSNGKLVIKAGTYPAFSNYTFTWMSVEKSVPSSYGKGRELILDPSNAKIYSDRFNFVLKIDPSCPAYTSPEIRVSTKDGDGNIYPSVLIGNQEWMMNNLRSTKFQNGTPLNSYYSSPGTWNSYPSYAWFNNDSIDNFLNFGALYNYQVFTNAAVSNMCPSGWHAATSYDWASLFTYVQQNKGLPVSSYLKSDLYWTNSINNGNIFLFNANPAGELNSIGNYTGKYNSTVWWAPPSVNLPLNQNESILPAYKIISGPGVPSLINYSLPANNIPTGYSIRCIREYK